MLIAPFPAYAVDVSLIKLKQQADDMTTYKVALFNPKVPTLNNETPVQRIQRLAVMLAQADAQSCRIFLAPEFYFTHNSQVLDEQPPSLCIAYTEQEMETVLTKVGALAMQYNKMLIVPGTLFWQDSTSLYNSSFVFYQQATPIASNSKYNATPSDREYAKPCRKGLEAGEKGVAFKLSGLSCYLQICQDTTEGPDRDDYDLSIVPAYRPGLAQSSKQNLFKYRILSDGAGRYYLYDRANDKADTGENPFYITSIDL